MHSDDLEKLKAQLLQQQDQLTAISQQTPADPAAQDLREQADALEEPVQFEDPETEEMLQKTDELIQSLTGQNQ